MTEGRAMTLEERIAELMPVFTDDSSCVNEQVKEPCDNDPIVDAEPNIHTVSPDIVLSETIPEESMPLNENQKAVEPKQESMPLNENQTTIELKQESMNLNEAKENQKTVEQSTEPKKPRLPSRYAQKQAEFDRAREMEAKAKGKKPIAAKSEPIKQENVAPGTEMKRVMIAGKWKFVPVTANEPVKVTKASVPKETVTKKVPYANIIKQDAIKRIEKNATSIAELQRIQYEADLSDLNTKDISVRDLRKLRQQKLEKERIEAERAKKDTLINQIMRDSTKSEFSKLLQIRKLSQGKGYPRSQ